MVTSRPAIRRPPAAIRAPPVRSVRTRRCS